MKIIRLIGLCCLVFTQSCDFFRYMSTKDPVARSESEVNEFLQKQKFDHYDFSFLLPPEYIDSLSVERHALDLRKLSSKIEQSTIQLRIYDVHGRFVNGYAQCYGNMNRINILAEKEFRYFKQLPNNPDLHFKNEIHLWNLPEETEEIVVQHAKNKKYTFVIYWNIWSNHYSKIIMKNLKKYIQRFDMTDDSLIILVNTDNNFHSPLQ